MKTSLKAFFRRFLPLLLRVYFMPVIFLLLICAASCLSYLPFGWFTKDPASLSGLHPLAGIVSNSGVLLWAACTAVSFFSAALLRGNPERCGMRRFLFCAGWMTLLLLIDDFFMLHDALLPDCAGIPERCVYCFYAILLAAFLFAFRRIIVQTEYLLLLAALGFFSASVFVDFFQHHIQALIGECRILLEDGFKFLGIAGWSGYLICTGFRAVPRKNETHAG